MLIEAPTLICYATGSNPPKIVPARANRDWMDATHERFAHRRIPLPIANSSGWEILCPVTFEAWWHRGIQQQGITFTTDGDTSIFGTESIVVPAGDPGERLVADLILSTIASDLNAAAAARQSRQYTSARHGVGRPVGCLSAPTPFDQQGVCLARSRDRPIRREG